MEKGRAKWSLFERCEFEFHKFQQLCAQLRVGDPVQALQIQGILEAG